MVEPSENRFQFRLFHLIVVIAFTCCLMAALLPEIRMLVLQPDRFRGTWLPGFDLLGLRAAILRNGLIVGLACVVVTYCKSWVLTGRLQVSILKLFAITTLSSVVFAVIRANPTHQVALGLVVTLCAQLMLLALTVGVFRHVESVGEGTYARSYLGLVAGGMIAMLSLFGSGSFVGSVLSIDFAVALVFGLCVSALAAFLPAMLVVMWQDDGGDPSNGALLGGIVSGSFLVVVLAPFTVGLLKERTVDLLAFPVFFALGGFFANLAPKTEFSPRREATSLATQVYDEFDESYVSDRTLHLAEADHLDELAG